MTDPTPTAAKRDARVRARIGPWAEEGLADLSAFEGDTNFVVRAAAGSGKTTALVARVVALVRRGASVRRMAAITFTRKAAGEMSERLHHELQRARTALAHGPADERAAVEQALRDLQHGFIGTIHSFCARLLKEYPLAAGLPPDFITGIEEREEQELREAALEDYFQSVHAQAPERLSELEAMGIDLGRVAPFFKILCRFPDLTPYTDGPDEPPDMCAAVEAAADLLETWQARRPDPLPDRRDGVMKAFDRAEAMQRYHDFDTPAEQARFLECFAGVIRKNGRAKVTLKCWGERGADAYEAAKELRDDALPGLVEHTIRPALHCWGARVHADVMDVLGPAVEHYRRMRRDRGTLTHHDLLFFTRNLLRDRSDIRARIQERYRRFLVDEFQDTDPLQAEVLFYLTGTDPGETDWRRCAPEPGSLFIVGDDKQSIYRFRRADRDVFDEAARLVEKHGGEAVDLTRNFRSLGALCDWCNETFEQLFSAPELEAVQAAYVPFHAHRPDGADVHGVRRIDIDKQRGNYAGPIAGQDAERIAQFIRAAKDGRHAQFAGTEEDEEAVVQGDVSYADFLILTRTKARLHVYADALARHGIPYTVTGSGDLGTSPEVRALVGLLTCALRPDDPVACAAYLRGDCCGLSDDDLYRFHRAGGRFDRMHEPLPDAVQAELPTPLADRCRAAFERIRTARQLLVAVRPTLAIEEIVRTTGLLAAAAHPTEAAAGSLRAGQMLRALSYVRDLAGQGAGWADIVEELQRVIDDEEALDGMTLETGRGDAVRVMNVHQAKGLEAPVVFLADPYSRGAGSHAPDLHIRRATEEVVLPVVQGRGHYQTVTHAPLGWHDDSEHAFRAREAQHEAAEEHRLLYVAATRAKNLLVVSTYPEKRDKGYWSDLYDALDRADVPLLRAVPTEAAERQAAPAPGLAAARQQRDEHIAACARSTYRAVSVTGEEASVQAMGMGGYGKSFGEAMHALFELLIRRRASIAEVEQVPLRALFAQAGFDASAEDVRRARRMASGLLRSALYEEVRAAPTVHTEYPLATVADGSPPAVERGVIDLIYDGKDGWHIVDFKTDRVSDAERAHALRASHPYVQQVRQYAEGWSRLAEAPGVQAGLWFADVETYVEVR